MLDVGDTITLTYPSKPASPTSVTVTVGLPDGTTTAPTSAMSGSYVYTPTQVGRHTVLWLSSGPSDSYSDTFDVTPGDSGSIISLADAKMQLRVTQSSNDDELRLFLAATTALIEHEVGPVVPATHVEIRDYAETIVLSRAPVMSLTSVVPLFPILGSYFPTPVYVLDGPSGLLRHQPVYFSNVASWIPYGLRLTVTYMAGRPVVPAPLQVAARIIVAHLWETRRGAGPKAAGGDDEMAYGREMVPDEAIELMAPYRRAPLVV